MRSKHSTTRNLRLSPDCTRYSTAKQQKTPSAIFSPRLPPSETPSKPSYSRRSLPPSATTMMITVPVYQYCVRVFVVRLFLLIRPTRATVYIGTSFNRPPTGKSYRRHRLKNLFQLVHVHPSGRLRIHRLRQGPSLLSLPTLASRSTSRQLTQRVQATLAQTMRETTRHKPCGNSFCWKFGN